MGHGERRPLKARYLLGFVLALTPVRAVVGRGEDLAAPPFGLDALRVSFAVREVHDVNNSVGGADLLNKTTCAQDLVVWMGSDDQQARVGADGQGRAVRSDSDWWGESARRAKVAPRNARHRGRGERDERCSKEATH